LYSGKPKNNSGSAILADHPHALVDPVGLWASPVGIWAFIGPRE